MSAVAPTRLCFGGEMKQLPTALCLSVLARALLAQGAPPQVAPDQPYTMEYYYKVQWGHQQEFLQLFLKNRSEEHTSELQSQSNLVCRLLLEKKKITVNSKCQTVTS